MSEQTVLEIPFVHHEREGTVVVRYGPNTSVKASGFDLLQGRGFDVAMCIGYPTLEARVARYDGTGYRSVMAWIQLITSRRHARLDDPETVTEITEVDTSPIMQACGVPFFAHGYPAALYDAPCNNLGDSARLAWHAETFMVTFPSPLNNDTASFLLGFTWGYDEWDEQDRRCVTLHPLEPLDRNDWTRHLPMLREAFPRWGYA